MPRKAVQVVEMLDPDEKGVVDFEKVTLEVPQSPSTTKSVCSDASSSSPGGGSSTVNVVINVGGRVFKTKANTILKEDWVVADHYKLGEFDENGELFFDRDGKHFEKFLNMLRAPERELRLPDVGEEEFRELYSDATFYKFEPLLSRLKRKTLKKLKFEKEETLAELEKKKQLVSDELAQLVLKKQGKEIEVLRVELEKIKYELSKTEIIDKHKRKSLMVTEDGELGDSTLRFNLLAVGISGVGKSSTINTLLDNNSCLVSGAQAQGTRTNDLCDGQIKIDDKDALVSYIDTQGLGADTSVTDVELLEKIMLSTETLLKMKVINNIIIVADLCSRATPAVMANQLTLIELFSELQPSCFLVFTKWNKNDVMCEWNSPLKNWMKKHRRAQSMEEIDENPPSFQELYKAYTSYMLSSLNSDQDGGAFSKMGTFLAFFESRLIFAFNLDPVELEDKEAGVLSPHIEFCYNYYRTESIQVLQNATTKIVCEDMTFLKSDHDTMKGIANELILSRDYKLRQLEELGQNTEKREKLQKVFVTGRDKVVDKIRHKKYSSTDYLQQMNSTANIVKNVAKVGCIIS